MSAFSAVKIFAATMVRDRAVLGETVTQWLEEMQERPGFEVVDVVVRQSSDAAYHCLSIVIFFKDATR